VSAGLASSTAADGRRVITVAALMATYMQAVNISLPNAAIAHLQGALSMAENELGWIFTSYIAASAIVMPMMRWLAGRYGRKLVYQVSIAGFALGLVLDMWATTPIQFALARIVQGAASGTLGPLSMAILLDVLPPKQHARIGLVWAICSMLGLVSGASIGGSLSEYHGWRSIFFISLPISGAVFMAMGLWLPEKKTEPHPRFDVFGWAMLSLGLIGLQMLIDRGERLEWFASAEIWVEATVSVLGFYLYIVHVLTAKAHFLNKALFKDRNFVLSTIMYFAYGFMLLPTLALTSPMLEQMLGYPVDAAGYMTIPRGVTLVGGLLLMSFAPAWIDNRLFMAGGMALAVYGTWRMLGFSPAMDWWPVVVANALQGLGLGVLLPALTKAAFATLDPKFRLEGTEFFNLARLYGSTIGIGVVLIFFYNNTQAMHLALAKHLTPHSAAVHAAGSLPGKGLALLNHMVSHQAVFIAVIDQFKVMMIAMLMVSPLVMFLRKSRPANLALAK
jgi:MFS transporter, DHA2 family, multidrug resistance protein